MFSSYHVVVLLGVAILSHLEGHISNPVAVFLCPKKVYQHLAS
jgi:hypothetical protein